MRTMIYWALIISSMLASCALNAAEERTVEQSAEDQEAANARAREWQKNRDEWLKADEGRAYVFWVCSLSGKERERVLEKAASSYLLLPMEVFAKTPDAANRGYRLLDCTTEKTSSLGYIWSNRIGYTWSPLNGYTWSDQRVTLSGFTWSNRQGAQSHA